MKHFDALHVVGRDWRAIHGRYRSPHRALGTHGATRLPAVEVDSYNLELKDDEGFLGDRASRQAFHAILENWRKPLRKLGDRSVRRHALRRSQPPQARRGAEGGRSSKPPP